jgi:hypothetical protein
MKRFLSLTIAVLGIAVAAQASAVCTTPQEMKVLQAAVLRQQLAAAAQGCHLGPEYSRFVAAYGAAMVQSDRALKQFFQSRTRAEGYDAYKARIARDVSLKSLHDPGFCRSAKAVFAVALHGTQAGKKTPFLIETGYESCRMVPEKPVMAVKPAQVNVARAVPVPQPRVVAKAAAAVPAAAVRIAKAEPPRVAVRAVAPAPQPVVGLAQALPPAAPVQAEEPVREFPVRHEEPPASVEPPQRAAEPRHGRPTPRESVARDDPYADGIPNAYKPGATWVTVPPPRRHRPHRSWSVSFFFGG